MKKLAFNINGTFKIALLSDLHFGEDDGKDQKSSALMSKILKSENVDFAIFMGDQVSGQFIRDVEQLKSYWAKALGPANASGTRFTTIFGNHDDVPYHFESIVSWYQGSVIALQILTILLMGSICCRYKRVSLLISMVLMAAVGLLVATLPTKMIRQQLVENELLLFPTLSYSQIGPDYMNGVSNFILPVEFANNTAVMLLFMDSGGGRIPPVIGDEQEQWLLSQIPSQVPSIVFFHIPAPEYRDSYVGCSGYSNEYPDIAPSHIMHHLRNTSTRVVFAGHDHGNSWCCPQDDTTHICYGRRTGYGGYGNWERGIRIISLDMLHVLQITTWIHTDNDLIEDELMV